MAKYEKVPAIENNFTVKLRPYLNNDRLSPHWHEHTELLLFTKGNCEFICNGHCFNVEKGDFVVVNSTEIHSYTASEKVDLVCILIYPEFFSDINFSHIQLKNLIHDDKYIIDCVSEMNKEYNEKLIGNDMMLKSLAYRLMAYLMRNYTESHLSPKALLLHNTKLERLNMVFEFISSHYSQKITTKQLAEMSFLNENHFCRFFKKAVGKSSVEYLTEFRVDKAAVLLTATDKTIAEIAASVGFEDINYFSRTFKKIKNITPSEYRKQNSNRR